MLPAEGATGLFTAESCLLWNLGAGMKTADERIDAALDSVLKASGLALKHNTKEKTLADMREAMRKVMADSYIKGSNDNFEVMMKNVELTGIDRGDYCWRPE